jgi:hypothetical protein
MEKITIYSYIASTKPTDSHILINKYGNYTRAKNEKELQSQLKHFVRENGDIALKELAKIHPDRELILEEVKENKTQSINNNNRGINNYSNLDGEVTGTRSFKEDVNFSKILIWGSFVLLSIAIIMKKQ